MGCAEDAAYRDVDLREPRWNRRFCPGSSTPIVGARAPASWATLICCDRDTFADTSIGIGEYRLPPNSSVIEASPDLTCTWTAWK
jgi:hypothetical protein